MKRLFILLLLCTLVHADLYVAQYSVDLQELADTRPDIEIERKGGVAQVSVHSEVARAELLHTSGSLHTDDVYSVSLDESVAQMGGPVSVGEGADTVSCIIDTGVNYSLPQFGSCSAAYYALDGTNISQVVQSDHPYANNENVTYTITVPGAESVAVHFVNITLEDFTYDNLDRVSILDSNNVTVAVYKNSLNDTWSPSVNGDTLRVQLTSDGSVQGYGFYIDTILNGTSALTMNWTGCRVRGGYDFVNNDVDPRDDHGHGTHVAGIVASEDGTYTGVSGMSDLLVAKALNASGSGYTSDIIEAIEWCTQQNAYYNVTSIVMSLGDGNQNNAYCSSAMANSINAAVAQNITVTVAAGNEGYTAGISSPACVESALPVGAVDASDELVYNRGNILDIVAPGISIVSAWYGGGSVAMSGTSMAAPHVAGAINLFQSWWYDLFGEYKTPAYLEARLNSTGDTVYDSGSDRNYSRVNLTSLFTPSMNYVGGSNNVNVSTTLPVEFTVEWNLSTFVNINFSNGTNSRVAGSVYNITSTVNQDATYYAESTDGVNSWFLSSRNVTFMVGPLITDNTDRVCSSCRINTTFVGSNISSITLNVSNTSFYTDYSYTPDSDSYTVDQSLSLSDGVYNVTMVANDTVGLSNITFELTVDTVPPTISSINVSSGPYYSTSTIVFNVSGDGDITLVTDETGSNITYTVNGSVNTTSRLNHITANYTFTITDDAGNTDTNVTQLFITNRNVDSITINSPTSIELGDATVLNATAVDPDNDTLTFVWSDGNQTANGSYTTMVFGTIGNVTLSVNASDVNSSVSTSSVIYVNDTVAPVIVSDTIASSYHLAYGDVEFNVTYLEQSGLDSATINISGAVSSSDSDSGAVLVFTPTVVVGTNTYYIELIEQSYNRSVNQSGSFTVETCSDGTKNGPEYGIDCGGSCPSSCSSSSSSSSGGGGGGGGSSSSTSVSVSRTSSTSTVEDVKEAAPVGVAAPVEPVVPQNVVEQVNYTTSTVNDTLVIQVLHESNHTIEVEYEDGRVVDIYYNGELFGNVTVVSGHITFFAGEGEYHLEPREIEIVEIVEPKVSVWEQDWFGWGMSNTQKVLLILSITLSLLGGLYQLVKPKELF